MFQVATFVGLPLIFSAVTGMLRMSRRFLEYWPAFFSYSVASVALFFMWLLDEWPARWFGLDPKSPKGTALGKVSDAVVLIVVIMLTRAFHVSLGSVFLQKGRLMLGVLVGLAGFSAMATFGILEAHIGIFAGVKRSGKVGNQARLLWQVYGKLNWLA